MSKTIIVQYKDDTIKRLEKIEKGDWVDLYAAENTVVTENEVTLIPLGVAMKLPEGYEAHLAPRSSTYKNFKIIQANSVGVVDNSYCGPNDWWYFPAISLNGSRIIHKGDKICQFRIMEKQPDLEFIEGKMDSPDRGGFGSTGTN
jgi:dUTP pyrophosphatase